MRIWLIDLECIDIRTYTDANAVYTELRITDTQLDALSNRINNLIYSRNAYDSTPVLPQVQNG